MIQETGHSANSDCPRERNKRHCDVLKCQRDCRSSGWKVCRLYDICGIAGLNRRGSLASCMCADASACSARPKKCVAQSTQANA